ncbi:MAG: DinB family protein [Gemmatimonadales bacterium]|nr:DinB family protein [Gemmatimonadales bacterium]
MYAFLLDTYDTERLKTLSVWSHFEAHDLAVRPEPRARTPHEHMVHQCLSEDTWMREMLGVTTTLPTLPAEETLAGFAAHYAEASRQRLDQLRARPAEWFAEPADFFGVPRSRAWILVRRIAHSAHHRGQLTAYLRIRGRPLHSTYGPTADTGGLFRDGAPTIYRHPDLAATLAATAGIGGAAVALPLPPGRPVTERPA